MLHNLYNYYSCVLLGTNVVDSVNVTIRHVECPWKIPSTVKSLRCKFCKKFRDNNLHI